MLDLGDTKVGEGQPVYMISEIGINHNSDLEITKRLIDAAFACGWNCVKFQKRNPYLCVPEDQKNKPKSTPWGDMTYLEYKHKMEFGRGEYNFIAGYCRFKPIMWTASVWDMDSVHFMGKYNVPFLKIPSAKMTDDALLIAVAVQNRPMVVSTGMSTVEEIDHAVEVLEKAGAKYALMHTNSSYPTPPKELNISAIPFLKERYGCVVGYCVDPQTKILTADLKWISAEEIKLGAEIIAFPESFGLQNSYCSSVILGKEEYLKERYYIETKDGSVVCSEGHQWPVIRYNSKKGQRERCWVKAEDLVIGDSLTFLTEPWETLSDYRSGYIAGLLDGEGHIQKRRVGFCQNPGIVFDEYVDFIKNVMNITTYHRSMPKCKAWSVDVNGRRQSLRLLGMVRPKRLLNNSRKIWEGLRTWHNDSMSPINKIEKMDKGRVIGIKTSTGTFIANGFLSHNSGHEYGLDPTVMAVTLGADIIERHVTLDHTMWGTDQKASLEVHAMDMLRKRVNEARVSLGDGIKRVTESEIPIRKKLRGDSG